MKQRFLFITRNYPPKVGGLEAFSYNLIKEFDSNFETYKLVLSRSNLHLLWFLPYCFVMALYIAWQNEIKYIHLCDALLSPIGLLLKIFTQAQISTSVVGLDVTFHNFIYQRIVPWCVSKMDIVVCISHATRDECLSRGISPDKCRVIPVGVRSGEAYIDSTQSELRRDLEQLFNLTLDNKLLLVTVGRLVKRKGVAWFVENVIPELTEDFRYFIVGEGPEYEKIDRLIRTKHLSNRVFLLGNLSDQQRNVVLNASDIFIMPNITVDGDIEGFGIVVLEAGSVGLPVIASNIQGIRDAVIDGRTGYLVEEGNSGDFIAKIVSTDLDKTSIRTIVKETFDWPRIAERYFNVLLGCELRSSDR
jgi:glycosyltransferase involved in cell wall biosynthesis